VGHVVSEVGVGIVAHTSRREQYQNLINEVDPTLVSVDDGTKGCDRNHRHTWLELLRWSDRPWLCVLEDDAVPVEGFIHQLTQALSEAPEPVVSLYLGRQRPPQYQSEILTAVAKADANDACWIVAPRLYQAVAVVVYRDLVEEMVAWTLKRKYFQIDDGISSWIGRSHRRVAHTWPSLVEHADGQTVAHAKRSPGRVAYKTGTRSQWTDSQVIL